MITSDPGTVGAETTRSRVDLDRGHFWLGRQAGLGIGLAVSVTVAAAVLTPGMSHAEPVDVSTKAAAAATPALNQPVTVEVGRSRSGRPIAAMRQGDPRATRILVVLGQMHGNERQAPSVVHAMRRITPRPGTAVWTILTMNPDGAYRATRKNLAGVDLNRNFPLRWQPSSPWSNTYGGPSPASEPETRAVAAFLTRLRPDAIISMHQPFNLTDGDHPKNQPWARALSALTGVPAGVASCGGACNGTLTSWYNNTFPGWAMTFELSGAPSQRQINQVAWVLTMKLAPVIRDYR